MFLLCSSFIPAPSTDWNMAGTQWRCYWMNEWLPSPLPAREGSFSCMLPVLLGNYQNTSGYYLQLISRYHICTQARTHTHPLEAAIAHNAFDWPFHQRLTRCPGWVSELPRVVGRNQWRKRLGMCLGVPVLYPSSRGVLLVFSRRILCFEDSPNAQICKHMKLFLELNVPIWTESLNEDWGGQGRGLEWGWVGWERPTSTYVAELRPSSQCFSEMPLSIIS